MIRTIVLAALALSAGCLEASVEYCANGTLCPGDRVCDDVHGGCVLPGQLGCVGVETPCEYTGVTDGACFDGVCLPRGCGNGQVDVVDGEVCDDGEHDPGDGCSPDCRSFEICGNGVLDIDEACDDGNLEPGDGCGAHCELPSCGDGVLAVDTLEQCDEGAANGLAPDGCRPGCRLPWCGDGVVDQDELCDDGNAEAGDGCRPDCASLETCGNGELDLAAGELCDDGALASHDGCASACVFEEAAWRTSRVESRKGQSLYWAMADDPVRGRLFGIGVVRYPPQMLQRYPVMRERVGDDWETIPWDPTGPTMRQDTALAWTPDGMLLFGGDSGSVEIVDDTWTWDGERWTRRLPATSPPARRGHAMTRDSAREVVVLFGGNTELGLEISALDDTWEWDGETWSAIAPATHPAARTNAAIAYDPARGVVMLFGGTDGTTTFADTWEWDGVDWIDRTPAGGPAPTSAATMAWDAASGRIVLIADETWEWDDDAWVPRAVGAPGGRVAAYSAERDRVVLDGGAGYSWELDGDAWVEVALDPIEPSLTEPAAAADLRRAEVVAIGPPYGGPGTETWVWNGVGWRNEVSLTPVPVRNGRAVTYDAARGRILSVGGQDPDTLEVHDDTWAWDGSDWEELTPATPAPPRMGAGFTFDRARGRAVQFGGLDGAGAVTAETWEWDGDTWLDRAPAAAPPPRTNAALVYDAARARVVLHGGMDADSNLLVDTWEWDGAAWVDLTPSTSPPPDGETVVYDPTRQRVLYFGSTTWAWEGAAWSPVEAEDAEDGLIPKYVLDASPRGASILAVTSDPLSLELALRSGLAEDRCDGAFDGDADGLIGCADPDCWWRCTPLCSPGVTCDPAWPRCGDATCDPLETCRLCPADCGACAPRCGDELCDPGETAATCPGDC